MLNELKGELFVGIRVTGNLQRHLDEANSRYEYLLEGRDEQSLQRVKINDQEVLGRSVEQGATVDSLSEIVRSLKSILLKYVPQYPLKDSEVKMYTRTVAS